MTAYRYKAPKGFLDVAGTRLGLNLVDLFDSSQKDQGTLEGLAPVFNMQTQYTTKGRGGVLSYKTPKLPTTTYTNEFSLIPDSNTRKSYTWPGTEGNKGGTGYGMLDLQEAIKAGYSEQEVGDYLRGNKGLFGPGKLNVGPEVRKKFGLDSSYEDYTWGTPLSANLGGPGYGGKDLEEALKFSSPEAVGNYLKANKALFGPGKLNVGPAVRQKFGLDESYVNPLVNSPTTVAKKSYNWNEYGNLGGPGFGGEDLAAAKAAQFSDDEIKDYIVKNKQLFGGDRLNVGPEVRGQLKLDDSFAQQQANQTEAIRFAAAPVSTAVAKKSYNWNEYGNLGGPGFGGEDLAAAKAAQFSDDEIKDYIVKNKQLFGGDRLNVGPAVRTQFGLDSSYMNPAYG